MSQTTAQRYRPDGWPLCPACGADELMSSEVSVSVVDRLRCLLCGWAGYVPRQLRRRPMRWKPLTWTPTPNRLEV